MFDQFLMFPLNSRYNSTTGTFTVPSGGEGFYLFSVYLLGTILEESLFDIQINGETMCTIIMEQLETSLDALQAACSAAKFVAQGNMPFLSKI